MPLDNVLNMRDHALAATTGAFMLMPPPGMSVTTAFGTESRVVVHADLTGGIVSGRPPGFRPTHAEPVSTAVMTPSLGMYTLPALPGAGRLAPGPYAIAVGAAIVMSQRDEPELSATVAPEMKLRTLLVDTSVPADWIETIESMACLVRIAVTVLPFGCVEGVVDASPRTTVNVFPLTAVTFSSSESIRSRNTPVVGNNVAEDTLSVVAVVEVIADARVVMG